LDRSVFYFHLSSFFRTLSSPGLRLCSFPMSCLSLSYVGPKNTGSYQSLFVPRRPVKQIKESALTLFFPFIPQTQIQYIRSNCLLPLLPPPPIKSFIITRSHQQTFVPFGNSRLLISCGIAHLSTFWGRGVGFFALGIFCLTWLLSCAFMPCIKGYRINTAFVWSRSEKA
jgi:hypothetical protein